LVILHVEFRVISRSSNKKIIENQNYELVKICEICVYH